MTLRLASPFLLLLATVVGGLGALTPSRAQDSTAEDPPAAEAEPSLPPTFSSLHETAAAGQYARFKLEDGGTRIFNIVSFKDIYCVVEVKEGDKPDDPVHAYEVVTRGTLRHWVRRAWVGVEGGKPARVALAEPEMGRPTGSMRELVGLSGGEFNEYEHAGRKWTGRWEKCEEKKDGEIIATKTWDSDERWFDKNLRTLITKKGRPIKEYGLVKCSTDHPPLLKWGKALEDEKEIETAENELLHRNADFFIAHSGGSIGYHQPIPEDHKVGFYAKWVGIYGDSETWTVVATDDESVTFEVVRDHSLVVDAYKVSRDKTEEGDVRILGRWRSKRGEVPEPKRIYKESRDMRFDRELPSEKFSELSFGDRKYSGVILRYTPEANGRRLVELWTAPDAPYGQYLKEKWHYMGEFGRGQIWRGNTLAETGTGSKPALNWEGLKDRNDE